MTIPKRNTNLSSNWLNKIDIVWFTKEPYLTSLPRQLDFHLLTSVLVFWSRKSRQGSSTRAVTGKKRRVAGAGSGEDFVDK